MAGILQTFLANLSSDQLLELLSRYLGTPESNRDSDFYLCLKSVLITLKEQDKLLDDLVCRVTHELCLPVVRCGDSHDNRQKIHIVYEITALCCTFAPRDLVQEVVCLCLEGLSNHSKEITTQTGLPVVVCVDFISYLMKDDVKQVVGEDLRKEMFDNLLAVLYHADELMCMKITSSVLPLFLSLDTVDGQERILIVWRMIKEMSVDKHNGDGLIKSCYSIMCSLADFFIADSNSKNHVLWDPRFWKLLQQGLNTQDPLSSKRSMYLLKRALDHIDKQKLNMEVKGDCGAVIFYWNPEQSKHLMEIWQELVLLIETLNETQVHVIKPVLPRISKIIAATELKQDGCSLALDISWLTTVVTKASLHPSRFIRKWAVMEILTMDMSRSPLLVSTNWSFLLGHFQAMINEYALYGPDDNTGETSPIGMALYSFYNRCLSFLPKEQHVDFLTDLLTAIKNEKFTSVPMVFISQALSCIKNTCVLGSDALHNMRNILIQLRTHPIQMRIPTKEFLLTSAANLTDPNLLDWDVIFHFLATGNLEECLTRGSLLWNGLCDWLWKIESEKQAVHSKENSSNGNHLCEGVFQFLGQKVESFLNNPEVLEDSTKEDAEALGRLIIATVDTLDKNQSSSDKHHNSPFISLLSKITQIFHDASTRLYMSETKLSKAATLLTTILRVLNSSDNYTSSLGSKDCSHNYAISLLSQSLKRSLSDILNLLYRKLTTVEDESSSGKTYLELCDSLHCFFAANNSLKSSRAEFYKLVEDVAVISVKTIQRLQESQNYDLKEWVNFQQSVLFVAWCCEIIPKCQEDLSASAAEQILHAVPSFQLNSEFKKPEMVTSATNGESTANNAAKSSSSWGTLVSELMSALWTIAAFSLQHIEDIHKAKSSEGVVAITSPIKDVLGAAIDALDITSNVLPIIKSIGLLIPNLLKIDVDSCSRALDIVWKTLRDMWSNVTFWEDFPVFLSVFLSPVLLMLPEGHQLTKKIKLYLEILVNEGESRPGVMHPVILQLSNVWVRELKADCHDSLLVYNDTVIQMLLFGPMVGKANRMESYVESYLRHQGNQSSSLSLDMRDDTQVRLTMINVLITLDSSNGYNQDLFKSIIRGLILWDQEINNTQTTIYINSLYHRKKHRAWQTILILLPLVMKHDTESSYSEDILQNVFTSIQDQNQVSVQNFQQWIVLNILTRYPHLTTLLWDELLYHQDKRVGRTALLATIAMLYAVHCVPADQGKRADVFSRALTAVFPWVTASHRNVRVIAQAAVQRMWYCCVSEDLLWVLKDNAIIEPCLALIKAANDTLTEKIRLLEYYFFFDFNPIRDLSIETIYYTIPKHSGITQEEWVKPDEFQRSDLGKTVWVEPDEVQQSDRIPLYNKDRRLANFQTLPYNNKEKFGVHLERRIREERKPSLKAAASKIKPSDEGPNNAVLNVQKKMIAWKIVPPEEVMMADLQQQRMVALQKSSGGNLVVVASLIDKAPNLGGLCRTSEIFGVRKLVIGSAEIMKDHNFKSLSVSSAKWIDIEQVRPVDLKGYLQDMRRQGYTLIGVEQTANSQPLTQYQFPHDALLLLGNEKEGIPADLIQLLDECVEIPQVGIIRSLNVHVSGALLIWEYTRQRLLTAHSTTE